MSTPLFICGPTASGKSGLAVKVASTLGGEIINADAYQLYRGLEVLSAAPEASERGTVPHHLYGVVETSERLDAARFRELALPVIEDVASRGRLPVVVGGSGLYLKFLTHEPAALPSSDPDLRQELAGLPLEELNRRLEELDPAEASTIDRGNPRYVQRALEICLLTGRKVSGLRNTFAGDDQDLRGVLLGWPPAELERRIRIRSARMLEAGALTEVARLPSTAPTAAKAIGVSEIRSLLAGEIDRDTCLERIVIATRRYAKRQRTWFRREGWLTPLSGGAPEEESVGTISRLVADGRT